jgi:hypothetical protein
VLAVEERPEFFFLMDKGSTWPWLGPLALVVAPKAEAAVDEVEVEEAFGVASELFDENS